MKFLNMETLTPVLHEVSLEPTFKRRSLKTEIAKSARGQKLQGPRAGDAMVEPYLVLKMLVN